MQYAEIFFSELIFENITGKKIDILLIFAPNTDCGYTLEPPCHVGSYEYPQSMFWSKSKKKRYTPAYPIVLYKGWVFEEYTLHGHVFLMQTLSPLKQFGQSKLYMCRFPVKKEQHQDNMSV